MTAFAFVNRFFVCLHLPAHLILPGLYHGDAGVEPVLYGRYVCNTEYMLSKQMRDWSIIRDRKSVV